MQNPTGTRELLLVILAESATSHLSSRFLCGKLQAASHLRSQFSGGVWLISPREHPVFRVPRAGFKQVYVPPNENALIGSKELKERAADELEIIIAAKPGCYVVVTDAAGIALRNLEHLVPSGNQDSLNSLSADLFWAEVCHDTDCPDHSMATPGLWAVRGEHFRSLLGKWSEEVLAHRGAKSDSQIWSRVVEDAPLRKRRFEKGEVYAPRIGAVDWEAVSNAAFVTVSDWPEKEQWKFLQALYFGTYFGDETGMMLNILDA